VIANLAIATAKAGMRTVLIDADLRRPTQHQIFNASNFQGLSTYLKGSNQFWEDLAIQTSLPNLVLMPSGPVPPNSADLLSVGRMQEMLRAMEDFADIILIDTPPVLQFSDALIIAAEVDAVMVVCKSEHTRLDALRRTVNALEPSNSRLVGVVLNQQTSRDNDFGNSAYYKPVPRPLGSQN
jgi:capsular exopolysaccharide synthesis family protein